MPEADDLVFYVVFDHPSDYPEHFVVRQQIVRRGHAAAIIMGACWAAPTLESIRAIIPPDKYRMNRDPDDDPAILEVWI